MPVAIWLGENGGADVWIVDDDVRATREIRNTHGQVLQKLPRKATAEEEAAPWFPGVKFVKPKLGYAARHPRVYRRADGHGHPLYGQFAFPEAWRMSRSSLKNLCIDMADIFRRVEPDQVNADTIYGHEIRNLLALACMEVEAGWRAVLKANNYGGTGRYSTNDYVKLAAPLRLAEYTVRLSSHPKIDPFAPFAGWNAARPTASLPWYDAYNETKHDREANFRSATLMQMIHALGASHVMMHAQFGHCAALGVGSVDRDDFYLMHEPSWPIEERYIPPDVLKEMGATWTDVDLRV
jgi:hypothetical protein